MKQSILSFVLTLFMSMAGLQAFAAWDTSTKVQVDDLYYYLDQDNLQAQVTYNTLGIYTGDIVIPSEITYEGKVYNVTNIGENAFALCEGLTSITIPNSVTNIGDVAFINCAGLTSITIPNSVTSIGDCAFGSCYGLTSVTIPNSVTTIGELTFYRCSSLTSITIPNSVTSIGNSAFSGCRGLNSMTVESENTTYDSRDNCHAIIETANNTLIAGCKNTIIPNSVTSIGKSAFSGCSGLTSITIPNSVTSIGDQAFIDCFGLTSITIPNSVTSIGRAAFEHCSGLTSVTIGNSVTSIGESAFSLCYSLTSITIPNSVTVIDHGAFSGCYSLTSVTIGNSVTSIGGDAFWDCSCLTSVTVLNPIPVTIWGYEFSNQANITLYVPKGSKEAYQAADYWKEFKEIIEIDVTGIDKITNNKKNNSTIFTLDGKRIDKPQKGINIINGKKVVVK